MDCLQETMACGNEEYLLRFRRKIAAERVPASGSIELTHRCNLNCLHCYLGPQTVNRRMLDRELGTARFLSLLDEITEAGCLFLLITGGDPLLRPDFPEIYRRARSNGLLVTVFTNGTLLTDNIVELFEELPPATVEISLYGATVPTYEKVTRSPGSFVKCLTGIEKLLDRRINVRLKTVLMTINSGEFYEIKRMADGYGVKFRFDPAISACLSGDKSPLELRVSPEEAVEKEFSDQDKVAEWLNYLKELPGAPAPDSLYICGAGVTNFHIDPYGNLRPCLMTTRPAYDLSGGTFLDGWRNAMPAVREIRVKPGYRCHNCAERDLCGFCPSFFELESDGGECYSEYHCALSRLRSIILQQAGRSREEERI